VICEVDAVRKRWRDGWRMSFGDVKHVVVVVVVVSTDIYRMRRWFAVDASCLLENIEQL